MITKHPLWTKPKKPSKKFREQYKKMTGLDAVSVTFANDKYYKLMEKLYGINEDKE